MHKGILFSFINSSEISENHAVKYIQELNYIIQLFDWYHVYETIFSVACLIKCVNCILPSWNRGQ